MPVDFVKNQTKGQGPVRLRFTRNTCYEGVDYGPGYEEQVAVVDPRWANIFISQGRAVDADEFDESGKSDELALEDMKKAQLLEVAAEYGVEVEDKMTKAQLIDAIKGAAGYKTQEPE